jgi:hypothetical protein
MGTVLTNGQHWVFVTLTSWIAILGGLALWVGFIYLGLIARRFEKAYGKITHWQFQLMAPIGVVGYLMMQSIASLRHQNMGPVEQWIGYTLLSWSAGLCLWGVMRFQKLIRQLSREE